MMKEIDTKSRTGKTNSNSRRRKKEGKEWRGDRSLADATLNTLCQMSNTDSKYKIHNPKHKKTTPKTKYTVPNTKMKSKENRAYISTAGATRTHCTKYQIHSSK